MNGERTYVKGLPLALVELGGFAGFGETVVFGKQDSCPEHVCRSHVGESGNMAAELLAHVVGARLGSKTLVPN
jgi:hypothetical protein